MAAQQTIIPGSVSKDDEEKYFQEFIAHSKWLTSEGAQREAQVLRARLERLIASRNTLNERIADVEAKLAQTKDRRAEARAYMSEASASLGKFASREVLLQVLRDAFPKPTRKTKTIAADGAATPNAPANDSAATDDGKQKLLSVLDREGMHMSEIAKAAGMETTQVRSLLKQLEKEGKIATEGERRSKKYRVVPE